MEQDKNNTISSLLICNVGDKKCAIDVYAIQEVTPATHITPVYLAPKDVLGVINLRGKIVTVLDCALKLQVEKKEINYDSKIVIIDHKNENVGLFVNETIEVFNILNTEITTPPENLDPAQARFISKVCVYKNSVIPILDLAEVISTQEDL